MQTDIREQPQSSGPRIRVGGNADHAEHSPNGFVVKWGETIGNPDCPLMQRWVLETPVGSLRLHHFLRSDDDRALHDHPWWFLTIPLTGGYEDVTERGSEQVRPFHPKFRSAGHTHAVKTDGCWTFIVTGRKLRRWGFWLGAKDFLESRGYFRRFGHAPCE